jgi:hypothetical protein
MSVWLAMLYVNVGLALALLTALDTVRPHLILSESQLERVAQEASLQERA